MKNKLSKRGVLFLVNGVFFVVTVTVYFLCLYGLGYFNYNPKIDDIGVIYEILFLLFRYMLAQCIFTFLSFVVYYLSIMADTLNKKYKEKIKE